MCLNDRVWHYKQPLMLQIKEPLTFFDSSIHTFSPHDVASFGYVRILILSSFVLLDLTICQKTIEYTQLHIWCEIQSHKCERKVCDCPQLPPFFCLLYQNPWQLSEGTFEVETYIFYDEEKLNGIITITKDFSFYLSVFHLFSFRRLKLKQWCINISNVHVCILYLNQLKSFKYLFIIS